MDLTGQSFPFGRNSAYRRRELISKFSQFVDLLEREVHNFNPIEAESEIVHYLLNTISEILEDGFSAPGLGENEDEEFPHYWSKITEIFDYETVRFVNSLEQFVTDSEKSYVWILIELFNKNIYNVFMQFSANQSFMDHYYPRSLIKKHGANVLEILKKLCSIEYIIESRFLRAYQDHVSAAYYTEPEGESNETRSPSRRRSSDFTPHKSEVSDIPHHKHNKSSVDSPFNIPGASASYEKTRTSSLFKSGSSLKEKMEMERERERERRKESINNGGEIQEFEEMDENSSSLKIATSQISRSDLRSDMRRDDNDKISTPEWKNKARSSKMRRTSSFQNMGANDSVLQVDRFISSPLQCSVHSASVSPKSQSKWKSGGGDEIRSPTTEDEGASTAPEGRKKLMIAGFGGIKNDLTNTHDTPIFQTALDRHGPIAFSNTERGPRNSERLYAEYFHGNQYQYEYKKPPAKKTKAEDQGNKCFSCGAGPNKKYLFFWSKMSYCSYTGYWYCENCMAKEKAIIPWNVSERWDFTPQPVCKEAYEELMELFEKKNMIIDYNSLIVKRNSLLYETLVTRRQLHLIFDMICEPEWMVNSMGEEDRNLLLKQNLFSLANLIEINRATLLFNLEKGFETINRHVISCEKCSTKGKICEICQSEKKIFHYDIKNTALCNSCKRLYHAKCFVQKRCPHCCK